MMPVRCSQLKISGVSPREHIIPCLFEEETTNSRLYIGPLSGVQFHSEKLACSNYG